MAIAKDEVPADDLTDKLKTYQELKEQYLTQKQELKDEGLEQKSLTDPDSRRMKNNGSLDICYNVQTAIHANIKKTALLLHLEERYSVGYMKMFLKLCIMKH